MRQHLQAIARRTRTRVRRALRADRGEVIPTAILWPTALLCCLIGVQVMFVHHGMNEARAAAQQAAHAQAAYGAPPGTAEATAAAFLAPDANLIGNQAVVVDRSSGTGIRVTVTGTVVGWLGLTFNISETGYAPIERLTTEGTP